MAKIKGIREHGQVPFYPDLGIRLDDRTPDQPVLLPCFCGGLLDFGITSASVCRTCLSIRRAGWLAYYCPTCQAKLTVRAADPPNTHITWRLEKGEKASAGWWEVCEPAPANDQPPVASPSEWNPAPEHQTFTINGARWCTSPAQEALPDTFCPRCGRRVRTEDRDELPAGVTCARCWYPKLRPLANTCRHHHLRWIRQGPDRDLIGCAELGCEARFVPPPTLRGLLELTVATSRPNFLQRAPDTIDAREIGPWEYSTKVDSTAFNVAFVQPNMRWVSIFACEPANKESLPPPGGWGFHVRENAQKDVEYAFGAFVQRDGNVLLQCNCGGIHLVPKRDLPVNASGVCQWRCDCTLLHDLKYVRDGVDACWVHRVIDQDRPVDDLVQYQHRTVPSADETAGVAGAGRGARASAVTREDTGARCAPMHWRQYGCG